MLIEVLKSKIHRATVTHIDLNYSGSIGIDKNIMNLAEMTENEKILIANLRNGRRLETYALYEPPDSKKICIYGPAGRLARIGDLIVIMSFGFVENRENVKPKILIMGRNNQTKHVSP